MDWTVKPVDAANHPPFPNGHANRLNAKPTETVKLSAEGSSDPDGHALSYCWFCYSEAGTFPVSSASSGIPIPITNFDKSEASFVVPDKRVMPPGTGSIHIILAVTDHGQPR